MQKMIMTTHVLMLLHVVGKSHTLLFVSYKTVNSLKGGYFWKWLQMSILMKGLSYGEFS